jgi:hypothetical protein
VRGSLWLNLVAFQVGWFACVLGAAHGWPWQGTAVGLAVAVLHVARAARPYREMVLVLAAVAIGGAWDSVLSAAGLLVYAPLPMMPAWAAALAPAWILAMYAIFATTLNVSLRWLRGRPLLTTVLGAVAGPASYWSGVRLGAARMPAPAAGLLALALGWALLLPALVSLARRFDGVQPGPRPASPGPQAPRPQSP